VGDGRTETPTNTPPIMANFVPTLVMMPRVLAMAGNDWLRITAGASCGEGERAKNMGEKYFFEMWFSECTAAYGGGEGGSRDVRVVSSISRAEGGVHTAPECNGVYALWATCNDQFPPSKTQRNKISKPPPPFFYCASRSRRTRKRRLGRRGRR
jgi:hypothetical protein